MRGNLFTKSVGRKIHFGFSVVILILIAVAVIDAISRYLRLQLIGMIER